MIAIITKELREHAKWGAAGMLGMAAAVTYAGYMQTQEVNISSAGLLSPAFRSVFVLGMPVIALALGVLQVIFENRRDQWAFLVHRPVSRSAIFWGKVFAGLGLYLMAVGLPYLMVVLWVATPGHVAAPFQLRMLKPGVADILAGTAYYFVGLLIGMRQARWLGSRLLPLGAAILGSVALVLPDLHWTLLALVPVVALLIAAAWGSLISGGQYRSQPALAKAALSPVLMAGLGLILAGIVNLLIELGQPAFYPYSYHVVSRSGQVLVAKHSLGYGPLVSYEPVPGQKPLEDTPLREEQAPMPQLIPLSIGADREQPVHSYYNYHESRYYFEFLGTIYVGDTAENWYALREPGVMVGFNRKTRQKIGQLGLNGFVASEGNAAPFKVANNFSWWVGALATPTAAYRYDLGQRRLDTVMEAPDGEPILDAVRLPGTEDADRDYVVVATTRNLHFFNKHNQRLFSLPLAEELANYSLVTMTKLPGRELFVIKFNRKQWGQAELVLKVSADGTIIDRVPLPKLPSPRIDTPWYRTPLEAAFMPAAVIPVAAVAKLVVDGKLGAIDVHAWIAFSTTVVMGIAASLATHALTRRHAFTYGRRIGWTLLNLMLGWGGFLTMLCLLEWPARVKCPGCGRKRVVTREHCEHCQTPFAPPQRDGTEVFEEETTDRPLVTV